MSKILYMVSDGNVYREYKEALEYETEQIVLENLHLIVDKINYPNISDQELVNDLFYYLDELKTIEKDSKEQAKNNITKLMEVGLIGGIKNEEK